MAKLQAMMEEPKRKYASFTEHMTDREQKNNQIEAQEEMLLKQQFEDTRSSLEECEGMMQEVHPPRKQLKKHIDQSLETLNQWKEDCSNLVYILSYYVSSVSSYHIW